MTAPIAPSYEVFGLVSGAIESDTNFDATLSAAQDTALELATDYATDEKLQGETWGVYILPHYCMNDADCSCVEHLITHTAIFTQANGAALRDDARAITEEN